MTKRLNDENTHSRRFTPIPSCYYTASSSLSKYGSGVSVRSISSSWLLPPPPPPPLCLPLLLVFFFILSYFVRSSHLTASFTPLSPVSSSFLYVFIFVLPYSVFFLLLCYSANLFFPFHRLRPSSSSCQYVLIFFLQFYFFILHYHSLIPLPFLF